MTVETKKYQIIKRITEIEDEALLTKLESLLNDYSQDNGALLSLVKPIRKKLDIEVLKKEQNYQGVDQKEVDQLIEEIDLQEPLEELLEMI